MRTLLLLTVLIAAACGTTPPPVPPHPPNPEATCEAACANLARLGCPEADPPKIERAGCVPVCEHAVSSGVVEVDVACIFLAPSVASVRSCNVRCRR